MRVKNIQIQMNRFLITPDLKGIVIDLGMSPRIDSTGFGFLATCINELRHLGLKLTLCGVGSQDEFLLKMMDFQDKVDTFPDKASAIKAIQSK